MNISTIGVSWSKRAKVQRFGVVAIFVVIFGIGMLCVFDYGLSTDEYLQRQHSLINFKYILETLFNQKYDLKSINLSGDSLPEYFYQNYGVAFQMPLAMMEFLLDFTQPLKTVFLIRHVYTFLGCYVGFICFYLICRRIKISRLFSILGVLMVYFTPRIFPHYFYNIKDTVFASLFTIAVYFALVFLDKDRRPVYGTIAGFFIALATNQRVFGIGVLGAILLLMALEDIASIVIQRKNVEIKDFKVLSYRRWLGYAVLIGSTMAFYYILTPGAWENPVQYFYDTLVTFTGYKDWNNNSVFGGKLISKYEAPWYYLPLWMGISLPVVNSLLILLGLLVLAVIVIRNGWQGLIAYRQILIITACGILPLVAAIIKPSLLYIDWRHVFFIYPMLMVTGVFGAAQLFNDIGVRWFVKIRMIVPSILLVSVLFQCGWIVRNHPYENVYLNSFSRGGGTNFSRDTWGLCCRQGLEFLLSNNLGDVSVAFAEEIGKDNRWMLDVEDYDRLTYSAVPEGEDPDADYLMSMYRYSVENTYQYKGYEEYHSIYVDGYAICTILKKIK